MDEESTGGDIGETKVPLPHVELRYWAAAKAAAGVATEVVEAGTVAEALTVARDRHRESSRFDKVISACSFLLDEHPLGTRDLAGVFLADGDVLDVLPPFAGG
jgi:sulfur-carrier protein